MLLAGADRDDQARIAAYDLGHFIGTELFQAARRRNHGRQRWERLSHSK
jgi:hypothetical protein